MANNTTPYGATGGVSIISYLQKQRDGVVFQETFENVNFLQADGWSVLRGSPANTQAQAVAGISSWDNTAGNQSMPIAEKVITDTNVDTAVGINGSTYGWFFNTWFYDPLTTSGGLYTNSTTYPGPYVKILTSDGKYRSLGVRNSVSTSYYCYANAGLTTDAPTSASFFFRSNGWNNFQMYFNPASGGTVAFGINNIYGSDLTTSGIVTVSAIYLCAGTSSDSGSSFGYFDNVGYYRNIGFQYLYTSANCNGQINLYNSSNSNIAQGLKYSGISYLNPPTYTNIFPISTYAEIEDQNSNLLIRTPLINVNPGDIYSIQTINFGRKVTTYDPFIKELQSVSQSTAGVRETNNYGLKGTVSFAINSLTGWSWKQQADNFFLNAVQGNPFGLMVDNVSDNAFGVIGTSAFGGETNTVQIMPSIVNGITTSGTTKQFTIGDYYYVRNNANTQKQLVNLVSMTTSTLTFDQNLNFNVNPVDYVYSLQYYPFLEAVGDTQAFKCTDPEIPRFKWTQNCADYNNG